MEDPEPDDHFTDEEPCDEPSTKELKARIDAILENTLGDSDTSSPPVEGSDVTPKPVAAGCDETEEPPSATENAKITEHPTDITDESHPFPTEIDEIKTVTENVKKDENPIEATDKSNPISKEVETGNVERAEDLVETSDKGDPSSNEIGQIETENQDSVLVSKLHQEQSENNCSSPERTEEMEQLNHVSPSKEQDSCLSKDYINEGNKQSLSEEEEIISPLNVPSDFRNSEETKPNSSVEVPQESGNKKEQTPTKEAIHIDTEARNTKENDSSPKNKKRMRTPNKVDGDSEITTNDHCSAGNVQSPIKKRRSAPVSYVEDNDEPLDGRGGKDGIVSDDLNLQNIRGEKKGGLLHRRSTEHKKTKPLGSGKKRGRPSMKVLQKAPEELSVKKSVTAPEEESQKASVTAPEKESQKVSVTALEEESQKASGTPKEQSQKASVTPKEQSPKASVMQNNQGEGLMFIPEGWRFYAHQRTVVNFKRYNYTRPHWDMYYVTPPPNRIKLRSRVDLKNYLDDKGKQLDVDPLLFFRKHEIEPALKKGILKYWDERTVIPSSDAEPCRSVTLAKSRNQERFSKIKKVAPENEKERSTKKETGVVSKKDKMRARLKKKKQKRSTVVEERKNIPAKESKSATVKERRNVSEREKHVVPEVDIKRSSISSTSVTKSNTPIRGTRQSSSYIEEKTSPIAKTVAESPKIVKSSREKILIPPVKKAGGRMTRSSAVGTTPTDVVKVEESPIQSEVILEEPVKIRSKPKVIKSPYFRSNLYLDQPKSPAGFRREKSNCDAPPRSPFNLIQEDLFHDPWQLLISTIFLNSTSGKIAIPLALEFLKRWPTPQAACQAKLSDILDVIEPLGFGRTRAAIIIRFSFEFLTKEWKLPNELYGIGKYGTDSYKIFCMKNEWKRVDSDDPMLMMYLNWRRATEHLRKKFLKLASNSSSVDPDDILPITPELAPSNSSKSVDPLSGRVKEISPSKRFSLSNNAPPKKRLRHRTSK